MKQLPTPHICGLGWAIVRFAVEHKQRMDEEGCGAVFASLAFDGKPWPEPLLHIHHRITS